RDTLPILLGVSSHDRYELEAKLRIAQRDLRLNTKQLEQAREAINTSHEKAISLYSEARAVGVLDGPVDGANADGIIEILRTALTWKPEQTPEDDGSRISALEHEIESLRKDRGDVQNRIDAARRFSKRASG